MSYTYKTVAACDYVDLVRDIKTSRQMIKTDAIGDVVKLYYFPQRQYSIFLDATTTREMLQNAIKYRKLVENFHK